jgi:hypothetical protein
MLVTASLLPLGAFLGGIDGISGAILVGFLVSFVYLQSRIGLVVGTVGRHEIERVLLLATGSTLAGAAFGLVSYWLLVAAHVFLAPWLATALAVSTNAILIMRAGVLTREDILDLLGPSLSSRISDLVARTKR